MDSPAKKFFSAVMLLLAASTSLTAQADIPLRNWAIPGQGIPGGTSGGLTTMTDISPGVGFTAIQPCRVVDTRPTSGFPGSYGGPIMSANAQRNFDINTAPHCPGIPEAAEAYSLNFTVTQTAGAPGDIRVWPKDNPPPPAQITSVLNWQAANTTIANATIIPAGTGGEITVYVAGTATHLLIDINGYFTASQNPNKAFLASGSFPGNGIIWGTNTANTPGSSGVRGENTAFPGASQVYGVHGFVFGSNLNNSAGVRAENQGGGYGLWASHFPTVAGAGAGVLGTTFGSIGVLGIDTHPTLGSIGVQGQTTSSGGSGVVGLATADDGAAFGVRGASNSIGDDSAGVLGSANEDDNPVVAPGPYPPAGVRGESGYVGTLGISEQIGAAGYLLNASGTTLAYGWVATSGGADMGGAPPWSFFGNQDIGSPGTKSFVEPHPTDADKIIQYVALEGPEAGTYFRGRGKFQNGLATIPVPEDFRMVTDPEGLTVQITPMGGMASVGVLRADLNAIVVQSSRNLEFSYLVQGVRRAFRERTPIRKSSLFAPRRPDSILDVSLAPDLKRRLVDNGTYNGDGTPNVETARRLGWDKNWEKKSDSRPE